ncbi:MAG: DUF4167 domain-containing protein [Caulobacteraceae bacterium]
MKRQRSRNRSGSSSGKPQQHNANRAFDSNGPEGIKVRGAAQSVYEKYLQLARDATSSGDRVLAENHMQHAEHYFRVVRAMQPHRPVNEIVSREMSSVLDIDFEDESIYQTPPPVEAQPQPQDGGQDGQQQGQRDQNQDGRRDYNRDRDQNRDQNRDQPRADRDQPRSDRQDSRRDRYDNRRDRSERPDRAEANSDPLAVVQPQATPLTSAPPDEGSPMLRSQDGAASHAPAFLQARPEAAPATTDEAKPAKKPRGRPPKAKAEAATAPEDA